MPIMVRPRNAVSKNVGQSAVNISENPTVAAVSIFNKTAPENNAIVAIMRGSLDTRTFLPIIES